MFTIHPFPQTLTEALAWTLVDEKQQESRFILTAPSQGNNFKTEHLVSNLCQSLS